MKKQKMKLPSDAQAKEFEMLFQLLVSLSRDMEEFSKKKPDDIINEYKVKKINEVLKNILDILNTEPTNEFLDILDEEKLPSYSDAVIELGQFQSSMKQFQNKYYGTDGSTYKKRWFTVENP